MSMTAAQIATFKTWLTANAAGLADGPAADLANSPAAGYFLWQSNVPKIIVDAQVIKANYTPTDAPPGSPSTDMTYQNRALLCQLKQTNAMWLTSGNEGVDARVVNTRQNFKDCLLAIPSGASGANQDAGWGTAGAPGPVRLALMRLATNWEKLFSVNPGSGPGNVITDARGANTNPDIPGMGDYNQPLEGLVTPADVANARL